MNALPTAYETCPFLAEVATPVRELRREPRPAGPCWPTADTESKRQAMADLYRRSGGLSRTDEVLFLLRRHTSQALSRLARWIVDRRVVSFEWQGQRLLPMFQFDLASMDIRPEAAAVLEELSDTFDDWELAAWFAEPNLFLQGRMPVDALDVDPDAVLNAARADRFVARG